MRAKYLERGAIAAFLLLVTYWYASPYLMLYQLKSILHDRNVASFNTQVDYPTLHASLAAQLSLALGQGTPTAGPSKFIDAMASPQMLMGALQPEAATSDWPKPEPAVVEWSSERAGLNRVIVYPVLPGLPDVIKTGFVFQRHGFANWLLSEVRLPPEMLSHSGP